MTKTQQHEITHKSTFEPLFEILRTHAEISTSDLLDLSLTGTKKAKAIKVKDQDTRNILESSGSPSIAHLQHIFKDQRQNQQPEESEEEEADEEEEEEDEDEDGDEQSISFSPPAPDHHHEHHHHHSSSLPVMPTLQRHLSANSVPLAHLKMRPTMTMDNRDRISYSSDCFAKRELLELTLPLREGLLSRHNLMPSSRLKQVGLGGRGRRSLNASTNTTIDDEDIKDQSLEEDNEELERSTRSDQPLSSSQFGAQPRYYSLPRLIRPRPINPWMIRNSPLHHH